MQILPLVVFLFIQVEFVFVVILCKLYLFFCLQVSNKRKKPTVSDVFNQEESADGADGKRKRKLVKLEYTEEEMKAVGQSQKAANAAEEKRKTIKNLIERIPTAKEELFAYKVDWTVVDEVGLFVCGSVLLFMFYHLHWASKETYHFFRATLTKIHSIKINHIWTQISFNTS